MNRIATHLAGQGLRGLAAPSGLARVRAELGQRWAQLAPRERAGVTGAATIVGLALLWTVALAPAWRTIRAAPIELAQQDEQLRRMQMLAAEAQQLRQAPPVGAAQAEAALRGATTRLGNGATLSLQGERATLTLSSVEAGPLVAWLSEVRGAARARVVEAQLNRVGTAYAGSIVLALPTTR